MVLAAQVLNLAIFSISHKIELKAFHDFELHYSGDAKVLTRVPLEYAHTVAVRCSVVPCPRYPPCLKDMPYRLGT